MGNSNPVNSSNQFSLFGSNRGSSYYPISGTNNGADEGYFRTRIGNPDAKWETSISTNIGVDLSLLSNKYEISIDFWRIFRGKFW